MGGMTSGEEEHLCKDSVPPPQLIHVPLWGVPINQDSSVSDVAPEVSSYEMGPRRTDHRRPKGSSIHTEVAHKGREQGPMDVLASFSRHVSC